jgi:hypothetical protein
MNERKIKKETRQVLFELSNGKEIEGEVFLGLYEVNRARPQRVDELLNKEIVFVPVKTGEGVILLNGAHVVSVRTFLDRAPEDSNPPGKRYKVRIMTTAGKRLEGEIRVHLPEARSRVKDYFNQIPDHHPIRFIPLFQTDSVLYVNQHYILSVED